MTTSSSTRYAKDVRSHVPAAHDVTGYLELGSRDAAVWAAALPFLRVRNNDSHTLYAYAIARALTATLPLADESVVLPAILLHDVGWSTVPAADTLSAIAPGGGRHDLVRQHEVEGARIARDLLAGLGTASPIIDAVTAIIDGHDTRPEALDLNDAIVKDADKIWRLTPDGLTVVQGWFGLTRAEALRLTCSRVHHALFTEQGRAIALGMAAIASMDLAPERAQITDH